MVNNLLLALFSGFIVTCIIDVLSMCLVVVPNKKKSFLISIKDFFTILIYCFLLILILYYCNSGAIRGIYAISMIGGTYIYYLLFAKLFRQIARIVLMPFMWVIKTIIKIIIKIIVFLIHSIEKIYLKLYNNTVKFKHNEKGKEVEKNIT